MPPRSHTYTATLTWDGALLEGAANLNVFSRAFTAAISGKPALAGSSDPNFSGDATRHNPEDLLLLSLASCHMLTWLYLAARAGIQVLAYEDQPVGTLSWIGDTFAFTGVTLHPRIRLAPGAAIATATALHDDAHRQCFIARSLNFAVKTEPVFA